MPKRNDLDSVLLIGSGPIVIGQGCEFDYAGVQACKALKAEGYRVILVNSNPATIMTDPNIADCTYIEPIQWEVISEIIKQEKPTALLPTMGGQTALNCALKLEAKGILGKYNVELLAASKEVIDKAEDRNKFRLAMQNIGLAVPKAQFVNSLAEALNVPPKFGFPVVIKPCYTLGGSGSGVAHNLQEFIIICKRGLSLSPTNSLLIEESLFGWKEFEMEVVRDKQDNCIIVCSIENIDPMGIHTGDSITVAPAMTLTDKEYQQMRNAAIAVLREIGVETGGSNVQFAVNPKTGAQVVIEMNPRVSRSSALASKATGFPIAKVATLLAVGYTLTELKNDMTAGIIPASFEPTIDYIVTKIPRFNFEKFPDSSDKLTTQMKSVGEVIAIGTTFKSSIHKAICSLDLNLSGFEGQYYMNLEKELQHSSSLRILAIAEAFRQNMPLTDIQKLTLIDLWFLKQIQEIVMIENDIQRTTFDSLTKRMLHNWKQQGFSDKRLSFLLKVSEKQIYDKRQEFSITRSYKRIDSCAAEFPTQTAYLYSCFDDDCESFPTKMKKVIVLGSGSNRIGQGIEFDYCCVQSVQAIQSCGFEAIMVNCNPETVSTDYDISDRLYLEPLILETVLEIVATESPITGIITQFGGQTPLKLAKELEDFDVPILGTSLTSIDLVENREKFYDLIDNLGLLRPCSAVAWDIQSAITGSKHLGFPVLLRPSYVLGGKGMQIIRNLEELKDYFLKTNLLNLISKKNPILLDQYLENAIEVDVDAIVDQTGQIFIAGIMENIEQAGIHSGDSACTIPPHTLSVSIQNILSTQMKLLARNLKVVGCLNAQFAIKGNDIYVLEVNPRASRTIPFVSKAIDLPLAKIATKCIMGHSLADQKIASKEIKDLCFVKYPVFSFDKFPEVNPILGPEMRSTGEVMGIAQDFYSAYRKSLCSSGLNNILKHQESRACAVQNKEQTKILITKLQGREI